MKIDATIAVILVSAAFSSAASADTPPKSEATMKQFLTTVHKGACPDIQVEAADTADISEVTVRGGVEYVIQPRSDNCYCSPTGNCAGFVIAPRGKSFRILLEGTSQRPVDVLPSVSHGHPDLILTGHSSVTISEHRTYEFDGQRYRRTKSVDE